MSVFFFTISQAEIDELLAMPRDEAIQHLKKDVQYRGKTLNSNGYNDGHYGLRDVFQNCDASYAIRVSHFSEEQPEFWALLKETFNNGARFHPLQRVSYITRDLSQMTQEDWQLEVKRIAEECFIEESSIDGLVHIMLNITNLFKYAEEKGHLVALYWE